MKKLFLVFPIVALLAAGCNSAQQADNQTPITQNTNPATTTIPSPTPTAAQPTPTAPPSTGGISDISISASPSTITLGQQIQIQWSSKGATSCAMTESDVTGKASDVSASKGGVYRTPTVTGKITYTVVCKDATGASKTLSTNVTVNPAAAPSPTQAAAATLSITSSPTAGGNESVTAGATNVKLASYTFSNPTSQSVSLGQFYLNVMASGASTFVVQNFKASVNGTPFTNGSVSKFAKPTNYLVGFTASSPSNVLMIPPNGQITVDIYGDISSLPAGTSGTLGLVTCTNGYDLTFNYCANAPQAINLVVAQ